MFHKNALYWTLRQFSSVFLVKHLYQKMILLSLPHHTVSFSLRDKKEGTIFFAPRTKNLHLRYADICIEACRISLSFVLGLFLLLCY